MPWIDYPGPDEQIPPIIVEPGPDDEVTGRYEEVDTSPARVALFRVVHRPPAPGRTPEQVRMMREDEEQYYFNLSVLRHLAHVAADELGFPARCRRAACRRAQACRSDRHEFDWSYPGPWMPPCAFSIRLVDEVKARVRDIQQRIMAQGGEAGR